MTHNLYERAEKAMALEHLIGACDLQTSEIADKNRQHDCPFCDGFGEVDGEDYYNFDQRAVGVQFFGVGNDFQNYEAAFRAIPENIALIRELTERLREVEEKAGDVRQQARDDALEEAARMAWHAAYSAAGLDREGNKQVADEVASNIRVLIGQKPRAVKAEESHG